MESIIINESHPKVVALLGPKGNGKSTTLVVLWLELLKQKSTYTIFTSDKIASKFDLEVSNEYIDLLTEGECKLKDKAKAVSSQVDYIIFCNAALKVPTKKNKKQFCYWIYAFLKSKLQ